MSEEEILQLEKTLNTTKPKVKSEYEEYLISTPTLITKSYSVVIVIPTYNEAKNITPLLDQIYFYSQKAESEGLKLDLKVLVVDDNSPDGTAGVVQDYQKTNGGVFLLSRQNKEGLGAAYIAGMKHAIAEFSPDIIFEMDADHSHSPSDVPRMVRAISEGADFVIGSRYINGGSTSQKAWYRQAFSFCANLIPQWGMGLGSIKDCSGGFRAIKREVLERVGLDSLEVKGYAFQIALLESVKYNKFIIKEIPIHFNERNAGESKMRGADMVEGLKIVWRVKIKRTRAKMKEFFGKK